MTREQLLAVVTQSINGIPEDQLRVIPQPVFMDFLFEGTATALRCPIPAWRPGMGDGSAEGLSIRYVNGRVTALLLRIQQAESKIEALKTPSVADQIFEKQTKKRPKRKAAKR